MAQAVKVVFVSKDSLDVLRVCKENLFLVEIRPIVINCKQSHAFCAFFL